MIFDLVIFDKGINLLVKYIYVFCKNIVYIINVWFNNIKKKVMFIFKRGIKVVLYVIGLNYNNNLFFFL